MDKVESVIDEVFGTVHDEPLPDSGNIIGFLQILLKTELECGQLNGEGEAEQARILENYKQIDTKNKAQAYVKYMTDKIEATKSRVAIKRLDASRGTLLDRIVSLTLLLLRGPSAEGKSHFISSTF